MKTAILVHGHFLGTPEWERVVWGNPREGVYGNVPKGLVEALRFDADTILFGTGASHKDGLNEGEYALKLARARWQEIPEFQSKDAHEVEAWLERCAVIESTAQNTVDEIRAGAQIAKERGAERLVLVACRPHAVRAHKFAVSVLSSKSELQFFLKNMYCVTSDTKYDNGDIEDVVVFEPPHRPDRPHVYFNTTLQDVVKHMGDAHAKDLNDLLQRAIEEYRKKA